MRAKEFLTEKRRKKKKSKKVRLARYFYPGFGYYGTNGSEDSAAGDMGGDAGAMESSDNKKELDINDEVNKFVQWAAPKLKLKNVPKIILSQDTEEAQTNHHTGSHRHGDDKVWVYAKNRNLVDILRTVFHELVHVRQGELGKIKPGSSYPGSPIEAEADMLAGKYIKIYGKANHKIFQ